MQPQSLCPRRRQRARHCSSSSSTAITKNSWERAIETDRNHLHFFFFGVYDLNQLEVLPIRPTWTPRADDCYDLCRLPPSSSSSSISRNPLKVLDIHLIKKGSVHHSHKSHRCRPASVHSQSRQLLSNQPKTHAPDALVVHRIPEPLLLSQSQLSVLFQIDKSSDYPPTFQRLRLSF